MAFPAVFGPEERLELIEGEIILSGKDIRARSPPEDYRRLRNMGLLKNETALNWSDGKGVPS